jgi:hypothetical protein
MATPWRAAKGVTQKDVTNSRKVAAYQVTEMQSRGSTTREGCNTLEILGVSPAVLILIDERFSLELSIIDGPLWPQNHSDTQVTIMGRSHVSRTLETADFFRIFGRLWVIEEDIALAMIPRAIGK